MKSKRCDPAAVARELRKRILPGRAVMERKIARTRLTLFGCGVPNTRAVAKMFVAPLKDAGLPAEQWYDVADPLLDSDILEVRQVAAEILLAGGAKVRDALTPAHLDRLTDAAESWAVLDSFASKLVGPAVRLDVLPWSKMEEYAAVDPAEHGGEYDPDGEDTLRPGRFRRRCALVASYHLNAGKNEDPERPFRLLTPSVCSDRDTMTWKAVSWTLRQAAKKFPETVRAFLAGPPAPLHASVVREVNNVLKSGRKSGV